MDDMFKQNLLRLRQPQTPKTFGEALFGETHWAPRNSIQVAKVEMKKPAFTEKEQVMESLERFAQEKLTEQTPVLAVEGGEISLKAEPSWEGINTFSTADALINSLQLEKEVLDLCLKNKTPDQVKILFVTESFRSFEEMKGELVGGFIDQLLPAFPFKTAELFSRMLTAMKLVSEEVIVYPTEFQEKDQSAEVMKVAGFYQPEVIVTLGAKATHKILKGQERLAMVHGQFFNRKIENIGTFVVVPLFHPSIIENNQNMKKTAWADMQKIMKHLKKL